MKAIIFDLDDTLFDCSGKLVDNARKRAAEAMVKAGLKTAVKDIYKKMVEITKNSPRSDIFDKLFEHFDIKDQEVIQAGINAYNSEDVENIKPFPDVLETLDKLKQQGYKLVLITSGIYNRQKRKVEILGLEDKFDLIIISDIERGPLKQESFVKTMNKFDLKPEEIVSVGDRINSEIKISNEMGMITVQMLHGRFKDLKPKYNPEKPDYKIEKIGEIPGILRRVDLEKSLRIVAIGGGAGLPVLLEGLKEYTDNLTAVVTVTDCGRSSGMLRNELSVLPPGDIRNCLISLSNSDGLLRDLFQYRFSEGNLKGHSFGNLFIAALTKVTGSFEKSIKETSRILELKGRVLPSTLEDANLCAELEDGTVVEPEVNIIKPNKPRIKELSLKPSNAKPLSESVKVIDEADMIIIGPGALFTSIITNLLVKGLAEAIRKSNAKRIYVCNIATMPGQTDNFKASDHVKEIIKYLGEGVLDCVLLNYSEPSQKVLNGYKDMKSPLVENEIVSSFLVENDVEEIEKLGVKTVLADLIENINEKRALWKKQDLLKHDPYKLAKSIIEIGNGYGN
jgi:uncharacterized cofD-like protein